MRRLLGSRCVDADEVDEKKNSAASSIGTKVFDPLFVVSTSLIAMIAMATLVGAENLDVATDNGELNAEGLFTGKRVAVVQA
jgi:hypothetical protein